MVQKDRREYYKQYRSTHKEQKAAYLRQYYQEHSDQYIEKTLQRQWSSREFVLQLKKELSCSRCGIADWRVLDFHHIDRSTKDFTIQQLTRKGYGRERILQEIAKCEVLCANCHRIVHWEERQG
jgi:hypothetical protein